LFIYGIDGLVEITVVERQLFTDSVCERDPAMFDGVEVGGVRGQEFAPAARPFDKLAGLLRLVKGCIVIQHHLPGLEDGHQTVLPIGLKESGGALALKEEGSGERVLVQGVNNAHPLGAVARLLPPARLTPRTPAIGQRFMIVEAGLIHIDQLLHRLACQLRPKLLPQCFVSLGVAKGLFLGVSPNLRNCRPMVIRFTPPHASAKSSSVASPCCCKNA
jgi:hypothetical protein